MVTGQSAVVVIPTYNEVENLRAVVTAIMTLDNVSVMVVDDGSPDGTGALADELSREYPGRVIVRHRSGRRGLGRSYVEGLRQALTMPVDLICQMDADLSHDPAQLSSLLSASQHADVAIGSRYVAGGAIVNWPLRRRLLSRLANIYIRLITGLPTRDCTSGYRCWRRDVLQSLPLESFTSDGYSFLVELLFAAHVRERHFVEVPIRFVERRAGRSKLSPAVLVESAVTPWRLVVRGSGGRG